MIEKIPFMLSLSKHSSPFFSNLLEKRNLEFTANPRIARE